MRIFLAMSLLFTLLPGDAAAQGVVTASAQSSPVERPQLQRIREMIRSLGPRASTPAQLVQLTRELPPTEASGLFLRIAVDYLTSGNWDLGATVLVQLLEQYPDEPAAADATLLLARLYSSSEVLHSQRQPRDPAQVLRLPSGWREQQPPQENQQLASGMLDYALYLANSQLQKHPKLAESSPLAFQCTVAARLSGRTQQYKSWITLVKHKRESAGWRERALAEDWLAKSRDGKPPLPTVCCGAAETPLRLDGVLEEPCWQNAAPLSLQSAIRNPKSAIPNPQSEILLAYDAKYCYIAARCEKIPGVEYAADDRPRSYDADLHGHDQVRVWLDADRDYATWFQLTIDHRGWTGDRCWLDAGWNPKWYVAAAADGQSWTVEAAIPWAELTPAPPRAGDAWAVAAQRAVHGDEKPSGFSLLLFD
jgi:hypothetical protein